MSGFTAELLEKKLGELNNSQQSIQTLSLWLIHHRKHHKAVVNTWFGELKKAKHPRKLTFMYLANDVIQNSRKKGPEYSKEFGQCLKAAFENVAKDSDDKTWAGLQRVLTVWQERSIYEAAQIASFREVLGERKHVNLNAKNESNSSKSQAKKKDEARKREREKDKSTKSSASKRRMISDNKPIEVKIPEKPKITIDKKTPVVISNTPIVDAEKLIKLLQELESSPSSDAVVREKIASLPPEVSDPSLLEKIRDKNDAERLSKLVDEACSVLADYNSRLAQELEERKNISVMLNNYTQNQKDALAMAEQKLGEYKDKLRKVVQVRNELKSHLQNLPDLSRLPSVTGLAPLPSACDLFNVQARANAHAQAQANSLSSQSPHSSAPSPADYELAQGTPSSGTS